MQHAELHLTRLLQCIQQKQERKGSHTVERIHAGENYNDLPANLKNKLAAFKIGNGNTTAEITLIFCRRHSIESKTSANKIYFIKEVSDQYATCSDVTISVNGYSAGLSSS